jgi:hypothetical protein
VVILFQEDIRDKYYRNEFSVGRKVGGPFVSRQRSSCSFHAAWLPRAPIMTNL